MVEQKKGYEVKIYVHGIYLKTKTFGASPHSVKIFVNERKLKQEHEDLKTRQFEAIVEFKYGEYLADFIADEIEWFEGDVYLREQATEEKAEPLNITANQVNALFWVLVRQNQNMGENNVLRFPMELLKTVPKNPQLLFEKKGGFLLARIPGEEAKMPEQSDIYVPDKKLIIKK